MMSEFSDYENGGGCELVDGYAKDVQRLSTEEANAM